MKQVYLDVCVLSRTFDDQQQARIRLETQAMELILAHVRKQSLSLITSRAHIQEVSAIPKLESRKYLLHLLNELGSTPRYDLGTIRTRAEKLIEARMGIADATHVAFAEFVNADFVTVDDQLLKQCQRLHIQVWCGSPLAFCDKEDLQ